MASEAETRKAMSDFGIKGKHLQDMVQGFFDQSKKKDDDQQPPPRKNPSKRYANSPSISRRTTPDGGKATVDSVDPQGIITKGVRP